MINACAVKAKPAKTRSPLKELTSVTSGRKPTERDRYKDRMSSAEGTEERVDDKGDSGTYCTCEGDP